MRNSRLLAAALAVPVVVTPLILSTAVSAAPVAASVAGATWTVDTARNLLTEYRMGASGAATPLASIHGAATGLVHPTGIAVGPSGALFVSEAGDNAITEYAAGATGDVAPLTTIKGSATGLDAPSSIVMAGRDLWVTDPATNVVEAFTAGSNGNELPAKSIAGHKTMLDHPVGVAIDPEADLLDAISGVIGGRASAQQIPGIAILNAPSGGKGYLTGYSTSTLGNVAPTARVSSTAKHPMVSPSAIVGDGLDAVLVADSSSNTVSEVVLSPLLAPLFQHVATTRIAGSDTGLDAPDGLSRDALNQLVVTNAGNGTVEEFGQRATGDIAPAHTISGVPMPASAGVAGTRPGQPTGLKVTLHRSKLITGSTASLSWKAPADTGGGIVGYDLETTQRCVCGIKDGQQTSVGSGEGLGLNDVIHTTTRSTSYLKRGLHIGREYAFRVVAVNSFGTSVPSAAVTATLPGRSGPPVGIETLAAAHSIRLFWIMPNHDGAERIRSYHVEWATCVPGNKGCTFDTKVTKPGFEGHTDLRHLAARTTYHLRVIAKTKLGLGKPSPAISVTTKASAGKRR